MKSLIHSAVLSMMCWMLATTASAQNLVTNPSFEDPVFADGNWSSSPPTGWTIPGGWGVGYEHGNPTAAQFTPHEGSQATRTDGSDFNKLFQTVTIPGGVKAGTVYTLSAHILGIGPVGTTSWAQMFLYDEGGTSSPNWVFNGWETVDQGTPWHQMITTLDTSVETAFVGSTTMTIELFNSGTGTGQHDRAIAWDDVSLTEVSFCPGGNCNTAVLNLDMGRGNEYLGTGFAPDPGIKWNQLNVVENQPGSYGLHTFSDSRGNDGNGSAFHNVQITTQDFWTRDFSALTNFNRFDLINDNWITDINVAGVESSQFVIEGLNPGEWYDLYLIGDDAFQPEGLKYNVGPDENGTIPPAPDWGTAFTVTDALGVQNGTTFGSINQSVSFKVQATDGNASVAGKITVDWTTNGQGNGRWGYVSGLQLVERVLGDLNDDGNLTDADAAAFILALTNPDTYDAAFPFVDRELAGDINRDGTFDAGDIKAFSNLLAAAGNGAASATGVPEPSTLMLLGIALCTVVLSRRRLSS